VRGIDLIFNLASPASPIHYQRSPIDTLTINSAGTYELLKLAVANKARFLLASTSEVYGDPQLHPQPEHYWGNVNPVGVRSCYDEGKRFAESLTTAFSKQYLLDARIVRIFNTYGPLMRPDDGRVIPNFINQALDGKPMTIYGDGSRTRSFCFVDDMVWGIYLAATRNNIGVDPINLGSSDERTLLELADLVRDATNSESELAFLPALEDEPVRRKADISRAKQVLGWEPTTRLEDGLGATIAWFNQLRSLQEEIA
jgi:nucleoside-diphosphate-sugar epimerase